MVRWASDSGGWLKVRIQHGLVYVYVVPGPNR